MHLDRYASPIVFNGTDIPAFLITVEKNLDISTIPCHCFIDTVIHHLVHEMMQSIDASGTNIHSGSFPYSFKALEDLDAPGRIAIC
jgi:hypothetical protein